MHYIPLPLPFFSLLVGLFAVLLVLLQLGALRYAYVSIGLSPAGAMLVLFGSLVGSYFNVPLAELPEQHIVTGHVVHYYGMRYVVPVTVNRPGTLIAANVGGAIIPVVVSVYLVVRFRLWLPASLAIAGIAIVSHALAHPVRGLGIAVPVFVPAVATAIAAWLLSRRYAAALAYIGGSIGTLVGADLLNLGRLPGLGAPVASIGGAGTFDGIFLTGVLAVLIAGLTGRRETNPRGVGR
jgi:uncharacterized membrane protein